MILHVCYIEAITSGFGKVLLISSVSTLCAIVLECVRRKASTLTSHCASSLDFCMSMSYLLLLLLFSNFVIPTPPQLRRNFALFFFDLWKHRLLVVLSVIVSQRGKTNSAVLVSVYMILSVYYLEFHHLSVLPKAPDGIHPRVADPRSRPWNPLRYLRAILSN